MVTIPLCRGLSRSVTVRGPPVPLRPRYTLFTPASEFNKISLLAGLIKGRLATPENIHV